MLEEVEREMSEESLADEEGSWTVEVDVEGEKASAEEGGEVDLVGGADVT